MTKKSILGLLAVLLILIFANAVRAEDMCSVPASTASGLVKGESTENGVACVWRGIPFAAPPVGELRWRAPQPAPAWGGVRETVAFGDQCVQEGLLPGMGSPKAMSENCLFLNIWRPKKSVPPKEGFPVMVWVHGGGYYSGGGDAATYWGDRMLEAHDMVVVTINYRLNIFGFMANPKLREEDPNHSTGGYGTLDQLFALKWVQDNISNFGGDPGNVTIFGESAGGWSMCTLLATPLAKGLFHKVIIESGACEASQTLEAGYATADRSFQSLGCAQNDVACMRKAPATDILKKGQAPLMDGFAYVPAVDGYILKGSPLDMIKSGDYNHVPVLAGTNQDEFALATLIIPKYYYVLPGAYESMLKKATGSSEDAAKLARLYPLSEFQNRPSKAFGRMFASDACLTCPTYQALMSLIEQGGTVYMYRFDYDDMNLGKIIGSFHSAEIPFVFNNLDRGESKPMYNRRNIEHARRLSKVMQAHWVSFAQTGDPNGPGLPVWPKLTKANPTIQVFDTTVRSEPLTITERCEFWQGYSKPNMELDNWLLSLLPAHRDKRFAPKAKP